MLSLSSIRADIVAQIEQSGGRHDEADIYGGSSGDLGLTGGPDSMSWEINGDLSSIGAAGVAAILMEVLHPSVMHGVFTQSSYRKDPYTRSRNTLGYVLRTTFGNTNAATEVIEKVKRIHSHVNGIRADGVAYHALDPELIAWVHTCIPWAIMTAFDRYTRPLSRAEKDQYLREQAVIGRMGGAVWVPETVSELEDYVERMRPLMAYNDQTTQFVDFLLGNSGDFATTRWQRFDAKISLNAAMTLMPNWARKMTGTYKRQLFVRYFFEPNARLKTRLVRWAVRDLPCKTLALARVSGSELNYTTPPPLHSQQHAA
ncbi:MAG: oxygenase MpaB family protein [Halioglobus sp.]